MLSTLPFLAILALSPLPDVPVSAPVYLNVPGRQTPLALASDAKNILAVWRDERPASGLYAARVSPNAFVFERAGVRIAPQASSAVAIWNGSRYVILWYDGAGSIFSRTFDNNSNLGDVQTIATGVEAGDHFAAFNGSSIAVTYRRGFTFEVAELDRDGNASKAGQTIANSPGGVPVITASGHDYVASWIAEGGSLASVRLANGVSSVQPAASPDGPVSHLSIASDGTNVLRVYQKQSQVFARLGTAAPLLLGEGNSPEVIWTDTKYIATFANDAGIWTMRIGADGKAIDPAPVAYSAPGPNQHHASPVSTWTGNLYVAWSDDRLAPHSGNFDVVGRADDGFATLISNAPPQQHAPDVAAGALRFMTIWTEERVDSGSDVFFARLSQDGTRLDARGVRLSRSDDSAANAHVVFDGVNFEAAWIETHNGVDSIVTNRISPDGALLDATNIYQFHGESCIADLDLTIDRVVPLAVWSDCTTGRVYAGRITRGGIMAAALPLIAIAQVSPDGARAGRVSASWNGQNFLVAWEDANSGSIQAARLTPSLNVIDTAPLNLGAALHPSVASAEGEFLIAYSTNGHVFARHLSPGGALDAPQLLGDGDAPAASRDSSRYLVAWQNGDIVARHVGRMNDAPIEEQLTVIATEFPDLHVALTPLNGGVAAVYERVAADRTYGGVYRTFFRTIMPASRQHAVSH